MKGKGEKQIDLNLITSDELLTAVGAQLSFAQGSTNDISYQFSGTKILGGKYEVDLNLGIYHHVTPELRFGTFTGFTMGGINYNSFEGDIKSSNSYWYSGSFYAPYLKFQLLYVLNFMTIGLGSNVKYYASNMYRDETLINQHGMIWEPTATIIP